MKLIDVLSQDKKAFDAEKAQFEVQQQDVNLQSSVIQVQQKLHACQAARTTHLRAGGSKMWENVLACDEQIESLTATLARMTAYRAELLG